MVFAADCFIEEQGVFIEDLLELLAYGDEIFLAELGYEALSMATPVIPPGDPGSASNPIDLTDDEDSRPSRLRFDETVYLINN